MQESLFDLSRIPRKYRTIDELDMHGETPSSPPPWTEAALQTKAPRRRRPSVQRDMLTLYVAHAIVEHVLGGVPRRVCKMYTSPSKPKYLDIKFWSGWKKKSATRKERIAFRRAQHRRLMTMVVNSLEGKQSYAMTLQQTRTARAACIDFDDHGEMAARRALRMATEIGHRAVFAIVVENRAHFWAIFDDTYAVSDVRDHMEPFLFPGVKADMFPSGNAIRLPFNIHTRKHTRGRMILADGREFNLDSVDERREAFRAFLDLVRTPCVPFELEPATDSLDREIRPRPKKKFRTRRRTATTTPTTAPIRPGNADRGKRLFNHPRTQALLKSRPEGRALLTGGRVSIDGDSSRSVQVASLVYMLVQANYPIDEVRDIASHLRPRLRDDYPAYDDDIERLILKYTARFASTYNPQPTIFRAPGPKLPCAADHYERMHRANPDITDREAAEFLGVSQRYIARIRREKFGLRATAGRPRRCPLVKNGHSTDIRTQPASDARLNPEEHTKEVSHRTEAKPPIDCTQEAREANAQQENGHSTDIRTQPASDARLNPRETSQPQSETQSAASQDRREVLEAKAEQEACGPLVENGHSTDIRTQPASDARLNPEEHSQNAPHTTEAQPSIECTREAKAQQENGHSTDIRTQPASDARLNPEEHSQGLQQEKGCAADIRTQAAGDARLDPSEHTQEAPRKANAQQENGHSTDIRTQPASDARLHPEEHSQEASHTTEAQPPIDDVQGERDVEAGSNPDQFVQNAQGGGGVRLVTRARCGAR